MPRYTYRVESYTVQGMPRWELAHPQAQQSLDYTGHPEQLLGSLLQQHLPHMVREELDDLLTGQWRVLVWRGEHPREGGLVHADAWATYNDAYDDDSAVNASYQVMLSAHTPG